jgi:trk system potassium uptake protein TrkH
MWYNDESKMNEGDEMETNIKRRELRPGQVLGLGFGIIILIGTLLLALPIATKNGTSIGLVNALFTATSAVCVTGLVVVDTGTYWTIFGKTIILMLIQIGGLGFMTMATAGAFIMGRRIGLRNRLIMQEALNQMSISGVVRLTKYVILTTFMIEGIGAFLLSFKFIPQFGFAKGLAFSVFHSISAFCNAGFDIMGNYTSLTSFVTDPLVNMVIMGLILIGGIGFSVIIDIARNKQYKKLSVHSKLVIMTSLVLLGAGFILFLAIEWNNPATLGELTIPQKILGAMFQSVTPRTAGFNTIPIDQLETPSKLITMVLMFIGGSPGSTAGGVKTTTVGIMILTILMVIRGKDEIEFSFRRISKDTANKALAIFGIVLTIALTIITLLTITEPNLEFIDIVFEVFSALGTVGLSTGITSSLSTVGKLIIAIAMFFGRVGPLTMVIALTQRGRRKALVRYPEGKVSVG